MAAFQLEIQLLTAKFLLQPWTADERSIPFPQREKGRAGGKRQEILISE
jgi:hypothetical protein